MFTTYDPEKHFELIGDQTQYFLDDTEHVVRWKGQSAVNMVPGYTRVRFYMKNAERYSFRFTD